MKNCKKKFLSILLIPSLIFSSCGGESSKSSRTPSPNPLLQRNPSDGGAEGLLAPAVGPTDPDAGTLAGEGEDGGNIDPITVPIQSQPHQARHKK